VSVSSEIPAAAAGPAPEPDVESAAYWEALRAHRVVVQRCTSCMRHRFPPMPACPYCGARGVEQVTVAGTGRIYSFVRVHRALTPAMTGQVPYAVAVVQLDEGPRLIGRVDGDGDALPATIDAAVAPRFVDHDTWTELRFAVVAS
jgi:uncharacterized OB-fold protein